MFCSLKNNIFAGLWRGFDGCVRQKVSRTLFRELFEWIDCILFPKSDCGFGDCAKWLWLCCILSALSAIYDYVR